MKSSSVFIAQTTINHVSKSSTQKSFPVFNEDLCQGDDFLVCAVLPDTVHGHADPRFLKQTHMNVHCELHCFVLKSNVKPVL